VWPCRLPLTGPCHGWVSHITPAITKMHPPISIKPTMLAFQIVSPTSLSSGGLTGMPRRWAAGNLARSPLWGRLDFKRHLKPGALVLAVRHKASGLHSRGSDRARVKPLGSRPRRLLCRARRPPRSTVQLAPGRRRRLQGVERTHTHPRPLAAVSPSAPNRQFSASTSEP